VSIDDIKENNSELLKLLTQNLPDMLWVKDLQGAYIYVNQAICDGLLMAEDIDEPIGKNDLFFALRERELHREDPNWHTFGELCQDSDLQVVENACSMKFEEYGNVKGKLLYLEVNKAPFRNKNGEIVGTVGTGRDITQLKKIQLDLEEKNKKLAEQSKEIEIFNSMLEKRVEEEILKRQNQEKVMIYQSRQVVMGEMLESIAHQWRQPLNNISLASARLETEYMIKGFNPELYQATMEQLSLNINYMSKTIDDFREFLHPNIEKSSFDLSDAIEETHLIIKAQLDAYNIQSIIDDSATDIIIKGFENEFKQVILILIHNSIDAIKERIADNSIDKGVIKIKSYINDSQGYIDISDNGGGIPIDKISNIFEAYFTTKHPSCGTGVGLYIARNIIINRMKGLLYVKNIDKGCCFTIRIPLE
jgi:PAS domain S-box-containing protein